MTREWELWKQAPRKHWRTGKEVVFPSLSKRAITALRSFDKIDDVSVSALYRTKGVGRKTVKEIIEVFEERGYPSLRQEWRTLYARDPVAEAQRAEARRDATRARVRAERAIISAACVYVDTADDQALRSAVAMLRRSEEPGR